MFETFEKPAGATRRIAPTRIRPEGLIPARILSTLPCFGQPELNRFCP